MFLNENIPSANGTHFNVLAGTSTIEISRWKSKQNNVRVKHSVRTSKSEKVGTTSECQPILSWRGKWKLTKLLKTFELEKQCLEFKVIYNFGWMLCSSLRPRALRSTWLPTWPKPNDC